MSGALREWILSLTGTAAVCALALAVCPEGRVRAVLKIVCGAVMAVALLSPLKSFDLDRYSAALSRYREAAEDTSLSASERTNELNRTIIQADCAAYILDKAEDLGMSGTVSVTAEWSMEYGCWYPHEAALRLTGDIGARSELARAITGSLGIPEERQYWEDG